MSAFLENVIKTLQVSAVRDLLAQGHVVCVEEIQLLFGMGPQGEETFTILDMLLSAYKKPLLNEDGLIMSALSWPSEQARAVSMLLKAGCSPSDHDLCSAMKGSVDFAILEMLLQFRFQITNDDYRALSASNKWKCHILDKEEFLQKVAVHVQFPHAEKLNGFFKSLKTDYAESSTRQWNLFKEMSDEAKQSQCLPSPPYSTKKRKAERAANRDLDDFKWHQLVHRIGEHHKSIKSDAQYLSVHEADLGRAVEAFDFLKFGEARRACKSWQDKIDDMNEEIKQMQERLCEMYANAEAEVVELEKVMAEAETELDNVNAREDPHEFEARWDDCASFERHLIAATELRDEIGQVLGC